MSFDRALEPKRAFFRTPCIVFVYDLYILINKLTLWSPASLNLNIMQHNINPGTIFRISLVSGDYTSDFSGSRGLYFRFLWFQGTIFQISLVSGDYTSDFSGFRGLYFRFLWFQMFMVSGDYISDFSGSKELYFRYLWFQGTIF